MYTYKILVIDDSEMDRLLLTSWLQNSQTANYEVIEASSAEEGLEILDEIIPDCILLDNIMLGSEMSGVDSLPFIKKTRNKQTPIIMVTGSPEEDVKKRALKNGVAFFLSKMDLSLDYLEVHIQESISIHEETRAMTV